MTVAGLIDILSRVENKSTQVVMRVTWCRDDQPPSDAGLYAYHREREEQAKYDEIVNWSDLAE